jgi:hypothetical protein
MPERVEDFEFGKRSQIAFARAPRRNLRACESQALGQLCIAAKLAEPFHVVVQRMPIECHSVRAKGFVK